uniref:Uncharacterized protein n=1 Tax=Rangifer tarandus platyrhynchus TaxID=3082113 RepID=A0ACB0FNF0_RANTA|nr:unnamed protein product [Rangifer tarandus platyrhynchus]
MLSTDHTLGPDRSPFASHPSCFPEGLLVVEPQALQGPGEVRGQRSQKLNGSVPGPGAWEVKTVQMEVQGQPGGLGGGQAEAAKEGFIQDLSLRPGALDGQKKVLAQDSAHAGRVCVIPKHRAELQGHVCL